MIIASDIFLHTDSQDDERQNYLVSAEVNRLLDPAKGNRNASHDRNSMRHPYRCKVYHLSRLAAALSILVAQVTAQVAAQVEKLLGAVINSTLSREELQPVTGIKTLGAFAQNLP